MELRQLRYFLAVAEEMNISAAARRMHMTQPALSRHIRGLEEDLGLTLIKRGARSISLTREGEVVAREGKKVLRSVEASLERMRLEIDGSTLRVGFAPSLAKGFLGLALDRFAQIHPEVRIELLDRTSVEMEAGIVDGSLDVMVSARNEEAEGVRWEVLEKDDWRVVLSRRHPLAKKQVLAAGDLDGERLLHFSKADYPGYWRAVTSYFGEQGINAKVAGQFDGATSLMTALEGGLGVALVAAASNMEASELLVGLPIEPAPERLCVAVGLPAKGAVPPQVEVFVEELKRAGRESR